MVFHGTILESVLWILFFADVSDATREAEQVFADDLNMFLEFRRAIPEDRVLAHMQQRRESVHEWGQANRVEFEAAKEHLLILHPSRAHIEDFKLLGCVIDSQCMMKHAVDAIVAEAIP